MKTVLTEAAEDADTLQARFAEIGLPESLMIELQITEIDLPWDAESQAKRDRFLKQGYMLVVDRRSGSAKAYFVPPNRIRKKLDAVPV